MELGSLTPSVGLPPMLAAWGDDTYSSQHAFEMGERHVRFVRSYAASRALPADSEREGDMWYDLFHLPQHTAALDGHHEEMGGRHEHEGHENLCSRWYLVGVGRFGWG